MKMVMRHQLSVTTHSDAIVQVNVSRSAVSHCIQKNIDIPKYGWDGATAPVSQLDSL